MKIGYAPSSSDLTHPVDRRKACFYFGRRGIEFERAILGQSYDIVYLSSVQTDIEGWLSYLTTSRIGGNRPKLIFDLTDSYLSSGSYDPRTFLRGTNRYFGGIASRYRPQFSRTLIEAVSRADAVVCGSLEGKAELERFNRNVHVIRDYFWDDIKQRKQTLDIQDGRLNVFWEGLSHGNREIFIMLKSILSGVRDRKVSLHVATGWDYCKFGGKYFCKPTGTLLRDIFAGSGVEVYFYTWNTSTFSSILSACDIALIPIPENDPIMFRKPENKLIGLWSAGIPVIATATPSYRRVMKDAGLEWTCETIPEWQDKISALSASKSERENYMNNAEAWLARVCSEDRLVGQWDSLFASLKSPIGDP